MGASTSIIGVGNYGFSPGQGPTTEPLEVSGTIVAINHEYFGGIEVMYGKATETIRQFGLVRILGAAVGGVIETQFSELPNTANQGCPFGVAMASMVSGQYGWVVIAGSIPVNSNASIAAGAVAGIAAAGQAGANTAGKQLLGAVGVLPSSHTVVKTGVQAPAGSLRLSVPDSTGWFPGVYLSGTGIAAGTTATALSPDGQEVTISAATTALVNGSVTATYNNATIHYPILKLNRPIVQGAIT